MATKSSALRSPALLIILDGFGLNPSAENNAVKEAHTPNFDRYFSSYPTTKLEASGPDVGLPAGQMGNSEVGHMTIGSGTIVKQDWYVSMMRSKTGVFSIIPPCSAQSRQQKSRVDRCICSD